MKSVRSRWRHRSTGFTLVEVLTSVGLVLLLAAMLFPVLSAARRRPRIAACVSNLRQIGLATSMYIDDHDGFMPNGRDTMTFSGSTGGGPRVVAQLDPYCRGPRVFACPDDRGADVDSRAFGPSVCAESCYRATGTSYDYFWSGLYPATYQYNSENTLLAQRALFWDASGAWHPGAEAARYAMGLEAWSNAVRAYRFNVLYWDYHVGSMIPDDLWRAQYDGDIQQSASSL